MNKHIAGIVFLAVILGFSSQANALVLFSGNGTYGFYNGSMEYSAANENNAILEIKLTNTSPAVNGGYLTGFAFNNPNNLITGITFTTSDSDFGLLGATSFSNGVSAGPNGQFDIGASTSTSYEGGGNPNKGLGIGTEGTFNFALTGTGLDALTEQSFFDTLSEGTGAGEGYKAFVVRYRGFLNQQSDKVPGTPEDTPPPGGGNTIPEPASLMLLGSGMAGIAFVRKRF